jgi:hypothetical protein
MEKRKAGLAKAGVFKARLNFSINHFLILSPGISMEHGVPG